MSEPIYCPTCGCPVRIGGEGVTKYYVPVLKEKADKLWEVALEVYMFPDETQRDKLKQAADAYEGER